MGEARSSNERKNLVIKTLIIVVLLLVAFLSTVIYIFAYPKTTVTLHDDETTAYKVLSQFKVKKYSRLGEIAPHEKGGYTFLYWAYEDDSIYNPNAELDMDALSLYATYSRNSYTITYHIQVYNEDAEQEGYTSNMPGYYTRTELFGETIRLPYGTVGDNYGAELLPELRDRVGYHFAGWTTKVAEEEVITASDIYNAGGDFVIPAGDVDLYAYWEKNEYEVVAHTGNEYVMDGLTPEVDGNGKFIIKNNRVQEVKALKYLDAISNVTSSITATLGEQDGLVVDGVNLEDYKEYEFKGWYLDENFTIPANAKYTARVNVVDGVEIPYLEYVDDYGNVSIVDSVLSGEGKYQFHLYSKWERKSYTISFSNNHSGSNGKLDPITIYKYDDHYGKFYTHTIDLKEVTTQDYLNSNKGYKFFAWSTTAQATDPDCVTYYQWLQDPISYDANGSIIESKPYYDFFTYRHEISEDKTFYTLWSRIRSVTFYQKNGSNRFNGASFVVEGIAKEWFKLPGTDYVVNKTTGATIGTSWSINDYQYFAGWRVGSGTTGDPILEKNANGTDNKEYYWIFSSTSTTSVTICAYWESIEYTVEYYLNDGTENKLDDVKVAGGKKTYYAGAPTRENYIFDGWSTEKYPDNTPKSAKTTYTSANSFVPRGSEKVLRFYASWTMNFTIGYDLGVTDASVTGTLPNGVQYSKKGKDLKLELSVGSGSTLKRTGYTFKGWVLKAQDGSYNKDIIFKAGNSLVFDFNGVNVSQGSKQGSAYIKGIAANQYPFFMDDTTENLVVLYAYWEAKEYTITIHDTATGETIVKDVKYGQDFNFAEYINMEHIGKKFIGISASETGPIQYSKELGMVLLGSDIVGDLTFYARYEIREIYITYMIKAADAGMSEDVIYTPAYGYSGYGNKPVLYNDELVLPTPPTYNPNYRFTHWYYMGIEEGEDGQPTEVQIPVYTGSRLTYEGDNLYLYANYVEETYTMEFKFINPLNPSEIITIDKDVDGKPFLVRKGSGIDGAYYTYINALLENYLDEKKIREYTLDGLFNTYQGNRYEFVAGQQVTVMNYPAIQSSNVLTFVTIWSANDVKFVYNSGEEPGSEKNTSYHTGKNYESTDSIMLEDVKFNDLNDGESVHRWYIKNQVSGEKLYIDKGAYLIGFKGEFGSISQMSEYITWTKVNGRYVGTINIYAETQQVFTIEYYRFNKGNLELAGSDTHIYDGYANILDLMTSTDALNGMGNGLGYVFNGWVVYSSNGRVTSIGDNGLVSVSTLALDTTNFADFKVFLYADISYTVEYDYLAFDGEKFNTVDLKTEVITLIKDRTLDYTQTSNYNLYHTITSMVTLGADTLESYTANGYEYYGYRILGNVYSSKEINNGFTLEINSNVINILCYVTTTRTVTYKLGSATNETFTSSNLAGKEQVTYTYVIGYDSKVVAERVFTNATDYTENKITNITIKDIAVRKEGYIFTGWQQTKDGSVYADVYTNGDIITVNENITFVTYFTTPEANTIKGYVKYLDEQGVLMKTVDVWNGTEHILLDGNATGYDDMYTAVYSWKRNGIEYRIGERFEIPLLIATGETFEFTAFVKDKYIITFETYTDTKPEAITTFADVENQLVGVPTLADGIEFSHWRFELTHEDGTTEMITIAHNDAIAFRKSDGVTPVKYSCTAMLGGYNLHIIPVVEGVHIYTLEAVAISEVTIKLTATSTTSTVTEEITVEYGATYIDPRALLTDAMKALETPDRGICAWTTDPNNTDITDYNDISELQKNITKITKKGLELYAVWQTKYTVTYAVEDDNFGYKSYTPTATYYFEGDTVAFDANVVKSIYYKGFNTVYYDNGTYIVHEASGNDYYYVVGFVASFGGGATQEYMLKDGSFKMPGSNVTLTPITKTITYRVDFKENAVATGDATLYAIYATDISEIDLTSYTAVRSNFKFLGWNTDPEAELPLTEEEIEALVNENTTFYAVWASNVFISFAYNGTELFSIPLNKQGKLSEAKVAYYMSIAEESVENGYLVFTSLNGSDRTYNYNDTYYYLNQYSYNNRGYETIAELCALNFTSSSTVNLMFEQVYTVKYMSSNPTLAEGEEYVAELIAADYFTAFGGIGASGIVNFTLAENPEEYTNKYYTTKGWLDVNYNFYNFAQTLNEEVLAVILLDAEDEVVTFTLDWAAKSFEVILNYTATPYTSFKANETAEDVKNNVSWTNVASTSITDEEGSYVSTTSTVTLVYGSNFVIQFNNDILENYIILGWSTTLYPLGFYGSEETSDILYRYMTEDGMYPYSETYIFDSALLGDSTSLVLYPVFGAVPTHTVHISAENGKFTYTVENDETMKSGYMADFEEVEGSSDFESQELNLYFYQKLTIVADKPVNNYYKFNTMTSTIGTANGNTVVINGTDSGTCSNYDDCHEEVEITYVVKTVTINAKLEYERELKSINDTTTVVLSAAGSSITLSFGNKTASLTIPANSDLGAVATISEYFKLAKIMSGEKALAIANDKLDILELTLGEGDVAELVFTVAPKSYKVNLELQGGEIGDIEYTSELFGDGVIVFNNQAFEVVYDAFITLPTPTLAKFVFNNWKVNGTTMNEISDYEVKSNLNITAYFTQNAYSAEYYLQGQTTPVDVHFVGGASLTVGRTNGAADGELISANTMVGYTHLGWTEKNKDYTDDSVINPTEKRDYTFVQNVKGEEITIKYVHNTVTLATIKVEYGTLITIPTITEVSSNAVEGKKLYGFATTATEGDAGRLIYTLGQDKLEFKRDLGYEIIDENTPREITLYAVYYQKYTYTIEYGTVEKPTSIPTATYEITAINASKEVSAADLSYTLSSIVPESPVVEEIFAGYSVAYEIGGVTTTVTGIVGAGETIRLEDPKNHEFAENIRYILTPNYEASSYAQEIKLYITNPNDETENIKINYTAIIEGVETDIVNAEYYPIKTLLNSKFFISSTPKYEYNKALQTASVVTWTIESNNKTFTTVNENLVAYQLEGYQLTYTENGSTRTIDILFSRATEGYNIAGGSNYVLKPIWKERYAVRYYDANNMEIVSATEYYDQGTQLKVQRIIDETQNYDREGFVFVGYARTEDAIIKYTSDFYAFEQDFTITNNEKDYNFYPAYSQIYTINFEINGEALNGAGGESNKINILNNTTITTYVGGPLVTLADYFAVEYTGEGYVFGGFTLEAGKLANALEPQDIIEEYTLNSDDLVDETLNIYIVWVRAGYKVSFVMAAKYKNGAYADTSIYEVEYFHNEEIDFEDAALVEKIENIEESHFVFKNFSYSEDGEGITGSVYVQGIITIYVNFDITYTIVYNLGEAQYVSDDAERLPEAGSVGTRGAAGSVVYEYNANANLVYTGLSNLYWTAVPASAANRTNFFDSNGEHIFTTEDLAYANNKYEINLYVVGSTARYTVNLHYFKTFADLDLSYDMLQTMETPDYSLLKYSVMTLELDYGTTLLTVGDNTTTSVFDSLVKAEFTGKTYSVNGVSREIKQFTDLLFIFNDMGYDTTSTVVVNNNQELGIVPFEGALYYYAQSYPGASTYVNNVYMMYKLHEYSVETYTYLVGEGANITSTPLEYSPLGINTNILVGEHEEIFYNDANIIPATIKDLVVFEPTEGSLAENRGYNFIGAYSAEYDGEGNIVKFIPISTEDWHAGTLANSYYIKQDNSVYFFYSEKQVKVTIQYSSPDNTYDSLSLKVLVDDDETDRITEKADGTGLEIIALYGQTIDLSNASQMPYTISYFIVDGRDRWDTDSLRMELTVQDDSELEEITIVVYFKIEEVNVYFYTNEESPFVGGGSFYGEISSITYKNALGTQYIIEEADIEITYKYSKHDKLYYNYTAKLPYGSVIIAINVKLNNYTVTKWLLNNDEEFETLNVVATDDCHLRAIFEANAISVEFYTSNIDGEEYAAKIDALTITGIKYGDKITLPYAIVEEELYVSTGWSIGIYTYEWGEETNAVIFGNEVLENNILKIYANSIEKYYLVFTNETDPSFDIPEKYKTRNELVLTEYGVSIPGSTTSYVFVNANDKTNVITTTKANSGETEVFSSMITLPEELQFKNNLQFGGWATKASTIIMEIYAFSSNHITNVDTHEIKLSIINSGMVVLKFYITNPAGEDIKLATTASETAEFNIDYIQTLYNIEGSISSFIAPTTKEGSSIVQWGNFFANDTDTKVMANYEFHGWSIVRQNALNTPSTEYANISDTSALMYTYSAGTSRVKLTNVELLSSLQALLDDEYYTFYAVWETKHSVVFNAENAEYTNGFKVEGKYAEGEVISLPNNLDRSSVVFYDLEYASRQWKGWEDTTKGVSRLFNECTSGIYTFVVPAQDLNMTPIWENGTSVIFNINFAGWREYFAETIAANEKSVSAEDVLGMIGYPFIPENRYTYTSYSSATVNGQTYTTSYREGKFWSAGDVIEVYKYASEVFSQEGIYSPYGNATYFNLLGWYIDINRNNKCDEGELISTTNADGAVILTLTAAMVETGTLTIYALWEPKSVEVKFYYTQSDAINGEENRRYSGIDPTSRETGFTVVYVPFGGKITSVESYATDTTIYMYSGYNTQLADYNNVKKMDELAQDQVFYRFAFWSQTGRADNFLENKATTGVLANTISAPIMDDTNLYPIFVDQYVVEFRTTQGGLISSNITQYVIDGEAIDIKRSIESVVTLEIVEEIYYLDASGNKVQLLNSGNLNNSVVFQDDAYQITDDHYVIVYVHINLKVRAYLPDYSKTTPGIVQLGTDYMIGVNQPYNPTTLFNITESVLLDFGGADFAGWYYSSYKNTSYYANYDGAAYKLNNSDVKRLMVVADNSSGAIQYFLTLNGSDTRIQLVPADGGLYICLYAHFATTTTIELPNQAYDFARLEYSDAENEYYSFSNASTSTKVIYYTAYNSNHAPEITVDLKYGYTISSVNHFAERFESTFVSADNVEATDIIESNFRARVSKTTMNEVVEEENGQMTNNLKVTFVFKVSNIKNANSLRFILEVEYVKFNVTYAYNKNEAIIQYYSNGQYNSLPSNESGILPSGQITLEDVSNPLYVGDYEAAYSFTLEYTATTSGDIVSVKFTGVPYGATLQIKASPVTYIAGTNIYGNLKYHFAHWTVSAVGLSNIDKNKVGEFEYNSQTYTPVLFAGNNLVKDYIITATMEQNRVSEIKYQFIVPTTTGSEWTALVDQLKDGSVQEYDPSVGYIITWSIGLTNGLPSGVSEVKAGDDITSLLNAIHSEYDRQFNSVVATSAASGNITSLAVLLNYFWFNNSWISLDKDLNNQVCFLDKSNGKNEIYVDGSGIVTIYSKLSEAVLVSTTHQTIDYLDLTTVISADRANVEFKSATLPSGANASLTNNEDVHIMTNSTENTITIKIPYGSIVEFEVKPDTANSQYSAYKIYNWMLTGGANDGVIGSNVTSAFSTKDNKGQFVTVNDEPRPEYKLIANVVIDTYAVNFKNDNGTTIKTINLGYDAVIASRGYTQYAYTLTSLYAAGYMMPLFDLDNKYKNADNATKATITRFNQSTDGAAEAYGEYKYLFSHWSTSTTGGKYEAVISNYASNTYKTVDLYAVYHTNTAIAYTLPNVDGGKIVSANPNIEFIYYLPTVNNGNVFEDMFGTQYSDSLFISNALADIEEANSVFDESNHVLYVGSTGLNDTTSTSLVSVDTVLTLRNVVSSTKKTTNASGAIQVYPAITYSIVVGHDDSFASADRREYTIVTLGGAYSVNMQGSNLKINNIVSISGAGTTPVIAIKSDLEQQFAYWEVRSAGTDRTLEYNISDSAYVLAAEKAFNTHFNLKFNLVEADDLGYGSAKVYKGTATSGSSAGFANISLFDATPSKKYVAPAGSGVTYSEDITNRKIYIVISGYTFRIEDRTSGTTSVLYTGVYTTSVTGIDKFWWDISYDDKDTGYSLIEVSGQNEIALNDADGSIVITPVVANDATINLQDGLYITNGSAGLNAEFANYVTLDKSVNKVSAGSRMVSNNKESNATNPWGTTLYFVPLNSTATTSANYIEVNISNMVSTAQQKLAKGTTNYRWQYKVGGTNTWRDYEAGVSLVNGGSEEVIYIRLACDWKEFLVTFSIMDTFNASNFVSTTFLNEGSSFDISAGLSANSAYVNSNEKDFYDNKQKDTLVFTLLYGIDTVTYDFETETFVVKGTYGRDYTANITLSGLSGLYSQGWYNFSNKVDGKIDMSAMLYDMTIDLSESPSYNYSKLEDRKSYVLAAWVEKATTTNVVVDIDTYTDIVNGHGTIDVSVDNIKGGNNPNTITNQNVTHGITDKKTPYITVTGGVSTKIWLRADKTDSTVGHKFINFSYENSSGQMVDIKDTSTSGAKSSWTTIITGNIDSSCSCNNYTGRHIHVLYDATYTASTFLAVDCFSDIETTVTTTLYGGYRVATSAVSAGTKVVITDFWNKTLKTINVVFKDDTKKDTSTSIYPRANYYINNTVNMKVSAGGLTYTNNQVTVTGNKEEVSNDFLLTEGNIRYNYMLGMVMYVHTLTLELAVQVIGADGNIASEPNGWKSEYISIIKQQAGGSKEMEIDANGTIKIKKLSYGDNIGVYYDITDGYMGMMLGVYASNNNRVDRLFVKNNTSYTLKGMDIYTSTSADKEKLVTGNYYSSSDSLDVYEGPVNMLPKENYGVNCPKCLELMKNGKYALYVRVQVRTETKISFQMNLPYASDLTNIGMVSNLVDKGVSKSFGSSYAVQNNVTSAEYYVNGGIVFNMLHNGEGNTRRNGATKEIRNIEHNLIVGRNFYVAMRSGGDLVFYDGDNQYGVINITIPSMYTFKGWYVYANNGIDVLVPGTKSFSGTGITSYDIWKPRTTSAEGATQVGTNKVSIDSDSTIYLVLERNAVTIKYDNGEWWTANGDGVGNNTANYDINTMLKYDYMKDKSFGKTTLTYPGGLVTVVPTDIVATDAIIQNATNWASPRKAVEFLNAASNPNAVVRNGLHISYADSDALTRAQTIIDYVRKGGSKPGTITSTITCSNSSFTKGKSVAIVGSTSTKTQATTFDVLLKDANTWYFVGVPTGDATHCASSCNCNVRKVNMYNAPKSEAPALIGTFSFEADLITLLQSIAMYEPQQSITAVADMYIAKNTSSRLYNGLYWGTSTDLAAPDKSYSNIKFTYTCPTSVLNRVAQAGSNTTLRAILSGYKVVVNGKETDFKHTFNNSIYSESGIYELLNLVNYGTCGCGYDVSIYPIWEALNVYSVKVSDSDGTLGFDYKRYALEGRTITYSWDLSSISIATSVSASTYSSSNLYTMYSTKRTNYVLSGLTLNSNPTAYGTSTTDTDEFKKYGVLRVVNSSGAYSVKQNNNGSVVSGGKLSFTVRPEQDMTFYAIWLRRGYSVTYQFNGTLSYGMSGTSYKIDITENTDNDKYKVDYATLLEGTPIKIAEGFDLSKIVGTTFEKKNAQQGLSVKSDILITDGCTISGYYSGTSGSTKWSATNLKFYNEISGYKQDKAVVGFALSHSKGHTTDANGSLISKSELTVSYGCGSGDHTEYKWLDWDCYFCTYAPDTNQTDGATERVYSDYLISTANGTYSAFNGYCMRHEYCKRCGKNDSGYVKTWYYEHGTPDNRGYLQEQTIKSATCTTNSTYNLKCSRCGYVRYKNVSGTAFTRNDKLGHADGKTTYTWVNSSNCMDGYKVVTKCVRNCGVNTVDKTEDPFTSHDISSSLYSGSGCTAKYKKTCNHNLPDNSKKCGWTDYYTPGHTYGRKEFYSMLQHKVVVKVKITTASGFDPWHCTATYKVAQILCNDCSHVGMTIRLSCSGSTESLENDIFVTGAKKHQMLCKCSACKSDVVLPEDSNTSWHACWQVWIPIWNLTVELPWQYKCGAKCSRKLTGEIGALNGLFSACWVTPTSPTDTYYKHPYDYHLYFKKSSNGTYSVGSWAVCYMSSGTYSWGGPSPSSKETDVPFYYFGLALTDALYSQNTSYIYSFIVDGAL